ncbi:serine hydrolase [Plantactinospora sp. B6F1]|uniref:serine hydrolase n=1 Tax=Plantactinospora sp. B6F1 TaxID=3158971 RepID=UPI0032D952AE
MRPRVTLVLAITAVVLGGLLLVPSAYARLVDSGGVTSSAEDPPVGIEPSAPPPPTLTAAPVTVKGVDGFFSWALLDRKAGKISGARNMTSTNSTESMIKVWIVSDYLRRLKDKEPPSRLLKMASTAIRDSNDDATNTLYNAAGGVGSLDRLIKMCGLTETSKEIPPGDNRVWWSYTSMSPRDAVRMGECLKDGTAAGPKWTDWVLDEMSKVRGTTAAKDQRARQGGGRWGIIDGLPQGILGQGRVSIKNGWTLINADGKWHLNCLAITDDWVLSVMTRYSGAKGLDFGADVCASVASQLVPPQPGAVLKVPRPLTVKRS